MPQLQIAEKQHPLFSYCKEISGLGDLARQYRLNTPIPHIVLQEFIDPGIARAMSEEFPEPNTGVWTQYKHQNENKLGMNKRLLFPPNLGRATDELNSPAFLQWMSDLTGIPNLIADPGLEGGGLHQSRRGGFLNVHTDFTMHHYHKNW